MHTIKSKFTLSKEFVKCNIYYPLAICIFAFLLATLVLGCDKKNNDKSSETSSATEKTEISLSRKNPVFNSTAVGGGAETTHFDKEWLIAAEKINVEESQISSLNTAVLKLDISNPLNQVLTINYFTEDNTAIAGADYAAVNELVTTQESNYTIVVEIPVTDDNEIESDETFIFKVMQTSGNDQYIMSLAINIKDNDKLPDIVVSDKNIFENTQTLTGNIETVQLKLSESSNLPVTLDYIAKNGTALSTDDFEQLNGTIEFLPGELEKTIEIPIHDDSTEEENETFHIAFSNIKNATLHQEQITIDIIDNDIATPLISDAKGGIKSNHLTWKEVPFAEKYKIYFRSTLTDNVDFLIMDSSNTAFHHNELLDDTKYIYQVSAIKNGIESDLSSAIAVNTKSIQDYIFDDFERPDQLLGGTTPSGQQWRATGNGYKTYGIKDGKLATDEGIYAYIPFPHKNVKISAEFQFSPTAADNSNVVLIADAGPQGILLRNMVHLQITKIGWALIYRESPFEVYTATANQTKIQSTTTADAISLRINYLKIPKERYRVTKQLDNTNIITLTNPLNEGDVITILEEGKFENIAGSRFVQPLGSNLMHTASMEINGEQLKISLPNGEKLNFVDERLPRLIGQYLIWQLANNTTAFESIYAENLSNSAPEEEIGIEPLRPAPEPVSLNPIGSEGSEYFNAKDVFNDELVKQVSSQFTPGIIPFDSTDESIILKCSLTSKESILEAGGNELPGSDNIFDTVKGMIPGNKSTQDPPGVLFDFRNIPLLTNLPQGQLSIEVEREWLATTVLTQHSTGASREDIEHLLSYGPDKFNGLGGMLYAETTQRLVWFMRAVDGYRNFRRVNNDHTKDFARITISWKNNRAELFIDGLSVGPVASELSFANNFQKIFVGSFLGSSEKAFDSDYYIRNIIVASKPVAFNTTKLTQRILQIGDSFSVGQPYSNVAPKYDGTISNTIIDNLGLLGIKPEYYALFSMGGGQIQDNGSRPIEFDTGTGLTREESIANTDPSLVVFITGGNDSGIFDEQIFTKDLHDHIEAFFGVNGHPVTNVKHLIVTTTLSNTAPDNPKILAMVDIFKSLPTWWNGQYPELRNRLHVIDMWTLGGGNQVDHSLFSTIDPIHPATTGNRLYGSLISRKIVEILLANPSLQ